MQVRYIAGLGLVEKKSEKTRKLITTRISCIFIILFSVMLRKKRCINQACFPPVILQWKLMSKTSIIYACYNRIMYMAQQAQDVESMLA